MGVVNDDPKDVLRRLLERLERGAGILDDDDEEWANAKAVVASYDHIPMLRSALKIIETTARGALKDGAEFHPVALTGIREVATVALQETDTPDEVDVNRFGSIDKDGVVVYDKALRQSDVMTCPHHIMVPSHYRDDGGCRCDDPNHEEMAVWGYEWKDGRWISDESNEPQR